LSFSLTSRRTLGRCSWNSWVPRNPGWKSLAYTLFDISFCWCCWQCSWVVNINFILIALLLQLCTIHQYISSA